MADGTYHGIADIQALLNTQQIEISASSQPALADVESWIAETEAKVDGALKGRYDLPPTGTAALALLREICAKFTASRVWYAVFGGATEPGARTYGDVLIRQAQDVLNALVAGDIELPDEEPSGEIPIGPGAPAATEGIERDPIFTMQDIF
jgi:hypothetical protein